MFLIVYLPLFMAGVRIAAFLALLGAGGTSKGSLRAAEGTRTSEGARGDACPMYKCTVCQWRGEANIQHL